MKFRQAVISIYKAMGNGIYSPAPEKTVLFRQPFNNLGLAFSFSFEKAFAVPVTDCKIEIENVDDSVAAALQYDYNKPLTRPLIEIFAGYSETRIFSADNASVNLLKSSLQKIYSGFPIYFSDDKLVGGRKISIDLTDISLIGASNRVSKSFRAGAKITSIIENLLTGARVSYDLQLLQNDPVFSIKKIETDLYFNGRFVLEDVLPDLARQYNFLYYSSADGKLVFRSATEQGSPGNSLENILSPSNGMIEFPNTINWVDYEVKSFFGLPDIFFPGDRVTLQAPNLKQDVRGLITNASYSFNDTDAEIRYIINQYGQPFNAYPVIRS